MGLKSGKKAVPTGFEEVALSRMFGWSYWELVMQPAWFIEKLILYIQAENVVGELKAKQAELRAKLRSKGIK